MTPAHTAYPKNGQPRAHSVLAKMNFGVDAEDTANTNTAQFFATGRAAELIAQAPGISGALSGDSSNNVQQILAPLAASDLPTFSHLGTMYTMLNDYISIGHKTDKAKEIKANLDRLDNGFFKETFKTYSWYAPKTSIVIADFDVKKDEEKFTNVYNYLSNLRESLRVALESARSKVVTMQVGTMSAAHENERINNIENYSKRYEKGLSLLQRNKDVVAMVQYVYENILLTNSGDE
jgi:hypothetical protein